MATHSSALAWKIPWMEEPGRLQSMGSQRVEHDWVTSLSLFTFMRWRRKWQPTPVFLPGKSHGWRSLAGCSPWGLKESDMTEQLHFHFSLSCIGEGNGNPHQCSCLENPRDGRAWWAAVYGVSQSRTWLKRLNSSSSSRPSIYWSILSELMAFLGTKVASNATFNSSESLLSYLGCISPHHFGSSPTILVALLTILVALSVAFTEDFQNL